MMNLLLRSSYFSVVRSCIKKRSILHNQLPFLSKLYYSVHVKNNIEQKSVDITWEDGSTTNFPHIYLRDHCLCSACFDPISQQRFLFNGVYNDYKDRIAKEVHISSDKKVLCIDWEGDEQHPRSEFKLDWLKQFRFASDDDDVVASNVYYRDRHIWGSEMLHNMPRFDFHLLLQDKMEFYGWLRSLLKFGITILDNVPKKPGQIRKLADRIAYLKLTTYG